MATGIAPLRRGRAAVIQTGIAIGGDGCAEMGKMGFPPERVEMDEHHPIAQLAKAVEFQCVCIQRAIGIGPGLRQLEKPFHHGLGQGRAGRIPDHQRRTRANLGEQIVERRHLFGHEVVGERGGNHGVTFYCAWIGKTKPALAIEVPTEYNDLSDKKGRVQQKRGNTQSLTSILVAGADVFCQSPDAIAGGDTSGKR